MSKVTSYECLKCLKYLELIFNLQFFKSSIFKKWFHCPNISNNCCLSICMIICKQLYISAIEKSETNNKVPVNQTQLEELDPRLRGNDGTFAFLVFPAQAGIQDI